MTTWQRGREAVTQERAAIEGSLTQFVQELDEKSDQVAVVRGTAVFLNRGKETAPLALRANVEHNHVRHEQVVIVSIEIDTVPRVPESERLVVDPLELRADGITHVSIRFGYTDATDVPAALARLTPEQTEGPLDLDNATYFLSKIELLPGPEPVMAPWRKRLFIATSHITADATEHFGLPRDRVILVGSHVEV